MDNLFIILLLFYQIYCFYSYNEFSEPLTNDHLIEIDTGISLLRHIDYKTNTKFIFNIKNEDNYQINIHSINCNVKIDFTGVILNEKLLETYSLMMNKSNNNITLNPLKDITEGEEKENYERKTCLLSINSINMNEKKLKIQDKVDTYFYLQSTELDSLKISYEIKEIKEIRDDDFIALFFKFDERTNISINVTYKNDIDEIDIISKKIQNSGYIFLNSEILINCMENDSNETLSIYLNKNDEKKNITMLFKIIEKDMVSIMQKNELNYGFISSKTQYQYYYMEVFQGEEGELVLHNKRLYGELKAKIICKNEINISELYNTSIYSYDKSNDNLNYTPHSLQLKYYAEDTDKCFNGCYILITYIQKKAELDFPMIGYEFTIFSRNWNSSDYLSSIIDIPFNEYILGAFEKGSITQHYYSIIIPDDAIEIIIQIEGNYIEAYYGKGRKKLNTMKQKEGVERLDIINKKNVFTLQTEDLNSIEKTMSFAIRPKDFFADVFSFYYFRILYKKENETFYLPMDSQLGNLCIPELDISTNSSNCYLMFQNNYNELATQFIASSSIQNEYFKIFITTVYKNDTVSNEEKEFVYVYNEINNDINYFLFKFEFENSEIKNIISSLRDTISDLSLQIYSSQMFYIHNFEKIFHFKLKNNYTLIYNYIFGADKKAGQMKMPFLNNKTFYSNGNFKGKPFELDINHNISNISVKIITDDLMFFFQLQYNMINKGIIEIKSGETKNQIISNGAFPLYYYLKIKNQNYINVEVNLRLNSYDDTVMKNDFNIKGYLLDDDTIKRKINGEYIQLINPIEGYYSNILKVGLIKINQNKENCNNCNYLLIAITSLQDLYINTDILVELVSKEYSSEYYFLPINQYIMESFDGDNSLILDKKQYYMSIKQRGEDQILIELSVEYNDIELNFTNKKNSTNFTYLYNPIHGFKKYRINNSDTDNVLFDIINPKKRKGNYTIRYYYTRQDDEYNYIFDSQPKREIISSNNDSVTISLSFKGIRIIYRGRDLNPSQIITFYISGLLYKLNESSDELINTTSILKEQIPKYQNQTINNYSVENRDNFILIFKDIPRNNNYIYDLQLITNVIIHKNIFNEEFLISTMKIDLTDIKLEEEEKEEEEESYLWYILGPSLGVIILSLIIFLLIKYIRLKKSNDNLQTKVKNIAFTLNIQKNVLLKDKKYSKKDTDFETTFI